MSDRTPRKAKKRNREIMVPYLPRSVHLTDYQKGAILAMEFMQASQRLIAAAVGCSQSVVCDVLKQRALLEEIADGRSAPRATSEDVQERRKLVKAMHDETPRISSMEIARKMEEEHNISVSSRTIQRDQRIHGGRHKVILKVPKLTEAQRLKRIEFCQTILKYPADHPIWQRFVFSDESKKGVVDMDHACWQYPEDEPVQREVDKWDAKIHVWGYIGVGMRHLELLPEGAVDGNTYLTVIKRSIGKWKAEVKEKRTWQQDNARPHLPARRWLEEKGYIVLDWPPNSPDLSPIENCWSYLWRLVGKITTESDRSKIWTSTATVWYQKFSQEYLDKLVLSFRSRLVICLSNEGWPINRFR